MEETQRGSLTSVLLKAENMIEWPLAEKFIGIFSGRASAGKRNHSWWTAINETVGVMANG
jgi:hypothetical protein